MLDRRAFLLSGLAMYAASSRGLLSAARPLQNPKLSTTPFTLGVCSGDPTPDGVVLWTRLALDPLNGGGMPPRRIEVQWQMSLRTIGSRTSSGPGRTIALPEWGHSVHVEVDGLQPDRWYWYRFRAGDAESPVGRTRTLPASQSLAGRGEAAPSLRASISRAGTTPRTSTWPRTSSTSSFTWATTSTRARARTAACARHVGREIHSLEDYRIRHAQYKTDADLQAMHAHCPWIVVWDDHELDNNYADAISEEEDVDPVAFLVRRANAYQAYYENMPLRRRSLPRGPNLQLFRKLAWGQLAEFFALDTRQYRTDQPCGDDKKLLTDAATSPAIRCWAAAKLARGGTCGSTRAWNVLAQQVMMGVTDQVAGNLELFPMDVWAGYVHERNA